MPVIARLSRRFYDVVGQDVADELVDWLNAVERDLTWQANLRRLNELSFARSEAKLEWQLRPRPEMRFCGEYGGTGTLMDGVRADLHQFRTYLLRWMFGFWITTLLGSAGLLIALRGH